MNESDENNSYLLGDYKMGCGRAILCIIFPPLAVLDCGCGAILLTLILTCVGWIPGVIAAIVFSSRMYN